MNCFFPLSPFHYFFSFLLLSVLFIAWESLSHYVTQRVTGSHQKSQLQSQSQDTSHIVWLEVQDVKCIDQVDYV